jgi:replicative DNA helicase
MSTEAEHALIGSILIDPSNVSHVSGEVSARDFADFDLGCLWDALVTLQESGTPIGDMAVVVPELRRMRLPGGVADGACLMRLIQSGIACHARNYAAEVKKASKLRQQSQVAAELARLVLAPEADPDRIASWLEAATVSTGTHRADCRQFGVVADEWLTELQTSQFRERIVMSGIYELDERVGGWLPGELVILAARTSVGKTAMAMQITSDLAERSRPVLFVSLEMKDRELVGRILCGAAEVDNRRIRNGRHNGHDVAQLKVQADRLRPNPLFIWAPHRATTGKIRAMAKRMQAVKGLDLLVVDYIGLIQPADSKRQRYEQIGQMTGDLKAIAKELNVPVLALCQLNRDADGQEPRLSQLRESGSIEQDADVVLFIHRESREKPEATLIVAKHRHAEVGKMTLQWSTSRLRFEYPEVKPVIDSGNGLDAWSR